MGRRPTIVDVAQAAGVSKSTVSLVLRHSPQVREGTRAEVRRAMAELGYVYNRAAAGLRGAGTGLVGLVINDLRNPFFTEFATSAQMALSARGYATVVANTDEDPGLQAQVVESMVEHGVLAIAISPAYGREEETFGMLERTGLPVLQVLRRAVHGVPFASLDNAAGGRLAVDHLLALGARRIAFVGGLEGRSVTEERMAGYLAAMRERGLETLVLPGRATRALGRDAAGPLLERGVEAATCFNDLVALGLLSGFLARGVEVGREVRVVGYDDIEECEMSVPRLTSVRSDVAGFGRQVAATLLSWIEEGAEPPSETRTPVSLVPRESSLGPRALA